MEKRLRILVLNQDFPPMGGGASPASYELAKGYAKLGHKVDVVTMHFKGLPFFEKKDGINICRVKCLRSKKELTHPWELLSYIHSAKKFLRNHLKSNNYDICHCHFIIPTGVIALWLKKEYNLPYIITAHGSDVLGYNKRFKYLYPFLVGRWKEIVRESKFIISPSKFLGNKINELIQKDIIVIPNGIDSNKFRPLKKEKMILVVAKFSPNKGIQDILDALKGVDLGCWKVDIVGEGSYRPVIEKKIRENGLSDSVKLHGWVDNNSRKMKDLYGHASIFISASHFENMSIVLLEALASGCYVIAANVGGNPEVISKKNLFEAQNIEDLRRKILVAIKQKMPKKSLLDKRFNWSMITKKYNEVLR